jgi:alpha-maltose-1-phosphate synthase
MGNPRISIASFGWLSPIDSGGGVIGWYLASKLHELGYLDKLIIFSKGKHKTNYCCVEPIPSFNYVYQLAGLFKVPSYIARGVSERLSDIFAQTLIDRTTTDILIISHPVFPRTLRKAKRLGIVTVLLALNPFDLFIEKIVAEEQAKWGVGNEDGYTTRFRLSEMENSYEQLDYILSATSVISETYRRNGWSNGKVIDLEFPLGPNLVTFKEPVPRQENSFRVSYLGQTVLLKGLQYLLQAWRELNLSNAELIIGGTLQPCMIKLIEERFNGLKNVTFTGYLQDINSFFRNSSVFVGPSLIDGAPRTVYEAMACGLPVIVTEGCGAKDVISQGVEGFVVPIRNSKAIADKICWLYEHQEEAKQMGLRAQEKIANYTIEKFADHVVRKIIGDNLSS